MKSVQVTKGITLVMMNHDDFFVSGRIWDKFYLKFPGVSFDDFWSFKLRKYTECNAASKRFFC